LLLQEAYLSAQENVNRSDSNVKMGGRDDVEGKKKNQK